MGGSLAAGKLAHGYREARVIAKPTASAMGSIDLAEAGEGLKLISHFPRFGEVRVLQLAAGDTVPAAVARLRATGRYEYVEPDYVRHAVTAPNDPRFASQWGLNNDGSGGGVAGADIHAESGWNTLTGAPGVIVGIVDSGALTTHEDLVANLWVNPSPGTSGSYGGVQVTDSLNGLNAVTGSGLPTDDLGHGTHVSGIVGAVGDNSLGVSGVAWKVQLMELKFIASSGSGSTADELPCIDYAIAHHASVLNASYGDQSFSRAEMDAIHAAGQAGVIFVCAAGNSSENIDISGFFPADYPLDNILCVGASDNRDLPVYFSNYGSGTVDIFAPGENILSTYYSGTSSYAYLSGTSMASPMVTGVVALLRARFPSDTYAETINRVRNSADAGPGLAGRAQSGGRVDLAKAFAAASTPPNALFGNRTTLVGLDPYTRANNADSPAALESGTPQIAGVAGSHSLWWQWTAPEDATVEIDTSGTGGGQYPGGSTYPTLLGVYTGTSLSSLALVASSATYRTEPVEGGNGSTEGYSEVTFHTVAGATYQINVEGQNGQSGQTILAINTTPDNDSGQSPRVLSGPSASLLDANSNTNGVPLWYAWTPAFTGPAQVSAYSYDFAVKAQVYTGTAPNGLTSVSASQGSAPAGTTTDASECLCAFNAVAGTTYLISVSSGSSGDFGEFTVAVDDARWQAATTDAVTCTPALGADGSVYVGSNDNSFYAFNADGSLRWTHAAGSVFDTSSAAIGADGTIYAGCTDGNLYAFSPLGSLNWTFSVPAPAASTGLDNGLSSSPAVASDGTVYFHDDDGNLYAVTPQGSLRWKEPVPGVSYAAPAIAPDGTVYIGSDGGVLHAFNPDGSTKWTYTAPVAGEEIYTAAAIDSAGNVYFATLSGNVYSVTPAGALRWSYAAGPSISSAPALANGAVYVGGYDANLYALSQASGAVLWRYALGAQVRASAPAVDANGVVYVGCYDHNVYAISPAGALVRLYASDDYIRSSPVIGANALCFGSEDHKVYLFPLAAGPAASPWPMYQYNAQHLGRAASNFVEVAAQPASQTMASGGTVTFSLSASGSPAPAFQWYHDGVAVANGGGVSGATSSILVISAVTAADAGAYTCTATSGTASAASSPATLAVVSTSTPGRLVNLSCRAQVGTGADIMTAGFVVGPNGTPGAEPVLLRASGPALGVFGLSGLLADPRLTLNRTTASPATQLATDTGWAGAAAIRDEAATLGAFSWGSAATPDSALLKSLSSGNYTAQVSGAGGDTGLALVEVYDATPAGTYTPALPRLTNLSALIQVGSGANVVFAGFVIGGTTSKTVLIRASGPALATLFGLTSVLADPRLTLTSLSVTPNAVVGVNTGWAGNAEIGAAAASVGAFGWDASSADSAMLVTLAPGNYTAGVAGAGGDTGLALIEVYEVP
jgi:outer membrane protein assembly factor BamB